MKSKLRINEIGYDNEILLECNKISEKGSGYKDILERRLFDFAVNIVKFVLTLPVRKEFDVFRYQLSRSGTSIGANYQEAIAAFNKKDFVYKLNICLKEARESNYWLRIIDKLHLGDEKLKRNLETESLEFIKIFTSSIKTARSLSPNQSKI